MCITQAQRTSWKRYSETNLHHTRETIDLNWDWNLIFCQRIKENKKKTTTKNIQQLENPGITDPSTSSHMQSERPTIWSYSPYVDKWRNFSSFLEIDLDEKVLKTFLRKRLFSFSSLTKLRQTHFITDKCPKQSGAVEA